MEKVSFESGVEERSSSSSTNFIATQVLNKTSGPLDGVMHSESGRDDGDDDEMVRER